MNSTENLIRVTRLEAGMQIEISCAHIVVIESVKPYDERETFVNYDGMYSIVSNDNWFKVLN